MPRHTFSAVFGAVIARGLDYRETFQVFRPGFDLAEERQRRAAASQPESFTEENLYPDARPCLAALREQGLLVGLAGNQTVRACVESRQIQPTTLNLWHWHRAASLLPKIATRSSHDASLAGTMSAARPGSAPA